MLDRAIDDLTRRGARTIGLDGVSEAVRPDERAGFRKVCRSLRFSGILPGADRPEVRPARPADLPAIAALDREGFGADRRCSLGQRLAALARQPPLEERADPPWRMVRGIWPPAPRESRRVTIGSPAKG